MSNKKQTELKRRFIEDVARLMMAWGVPQTAARLYAYLLLSAEPMGLDRIAADLEMSKSSASVAARLLEKYRLVRCQGERGSKRVLYDASDNYEGMLVEQERMLEALSSLLQTGRAVADAGPARARLEEMAEFYRIIRESMKAALDNWRGR
ncbi:GbsR/MarR family transcriptional regulator [Bradyrhizobium sp. STM 3562]|uniref:GbsR/MarR family transcriptional regulator n=1 Tax=Bradyrhizobium sp. STM 3562 TaxID=578924 RepID=UPI00388E1FD5